MFVWLKLAQMLTNGYYSILSKVQRAWILCTTWGAALLNAVGFIVSLSLRPLLPPPLSLSPPLSPFPLILIRVWAFRLQMELP